MTQEIGPVQEAWLQDLESGKFQQGRTFLYRIEQDFETPLFCCLGVYAYTKHKDEMYETRKAGVYAFAGDEQHALPYTLAHELGLRNQLGSFDLSGLSEDRYTRAKALLGWREEDNGGYYSGLTSLNDKAGWDFKQIAAFIREFPEAVFTEPK